MRLPSCAAYADPSTMRLSSLQGQRKQQTQHSNILRSSKRAMDIHFRCCVHRCSPALSLSKPHRPPHKHRDGGSHNVTSHPTGPCFIIAHSMSLTIMPHRPPSFSTAPHLLFHVSRTLCQQARGGAPLTHGPPYLVSCLQGIAGGPWTSGVCAREPRAKQRCALHLQAPAFPSDRFSPQSTVSRVRNRDGPCCDEVQGP